ncbi:MAG: DUF4105 domain-containing protein [Chthoniobacter sp.]|nr:DUF4105 domain-containing protein [Chthoniobacter sp.]
MSPLLRQQYTVFGNRAPRRSWSGLFCLALGWMVLVGMTLWAIGALWYDFPVKMLRHGVAVIYALGMLALAVNVRGQWRKIGVLAGGFAVVLACWLLLRPSNDRPWQPDVAEAPWAEIDGDHVTLHNVRNCEYRTETDYTPRWETREVDLSKLRGLDLAINYWGSAWMAHPIASFQFEDAPPVCFSIETRKEIGESYSAVGGLYRQFELVYVCADERDVLRVRTNYRHGEEIFLYHTTATPDAARQRFLEYITSMNELRTHPRWYNAATTNCTTSIRTQHTASQRAPWDWRMLFNGYGDEMMYERGLLAGGLPFAELKQRARINEAANAADADPDFSQRIRTGRPGFEPRTAGQ